ncbi:UNVERIFIED_CONTAM: F-box protein [Sesamum radiatum]|uniref:F-box protein n=1 Tax=Sesamum radiatum TaxID=300843 RepID=A0AAW2RYC6_SESRA
MRTRRGLCYPRVMNLNNADGAVKRRKVVLPAGDQIGCRKKLKLSPEVDGGFPGGCDFFDALPDDLVLSILCKLSFTATCPADFINVLITCKRLNGLGLNSVVLSRASRRMLAVKAKNWSESAHRFLKLCADTGNVEACFTLGMVDSVLLFAKSRNGASLMAKAAIGSHSPALYSLAIIQFNGSGGSKNDKNLPAGVALCARAAYLGHVDALRELGHCLQDGYGVKRNIAEGRRFLIQAKRASWLSWTPDRQATEGFCPLLSDFGCNVPSPAPHPANQFLSEWFRVGLPVRGSDCVSHSGCGRPETRRHEFRRCSVCGAVNYCSRACQALDWKLRHKVECAPVERWADGDGNNDGNDFLNGNGNGNINNDNNDVNGNVNEDEVMEES